MPHADRRLAHEGFERLVVAHDLLEGKTFDDEIVDHVVAQRRRPVHQLCGDGGEDLVLGVDHADLAHAVGIGGRERLVGHRPERRAHLQRRHLAKAAHQPVEIAPVGQQVELDDRLFPRVARGELDLTGLRIGLVDEGEQRADLLADRMPGRLGDDDDEHVAGGNARKPGGVAQPHLHMAPVCAFMRAPRRT